MNQPWPDRGLSRRLFKHQEEEQDCVSVIVDSDYEWVVALSSGEAE